MGGKVAAYEIMALLKTRALTAPEISAITGRTPGCVHRTLRKLIEWKLVRKAKRDAGPRRKRWTTYELDLGRRHE